MANYMQTAIRGAVYAFVLSFFAMLFAYLFRLLLARNLSTSEFGLFYAVFSLVLLINTLKEPGLKSAVVKFIPEFIIKNDASSINKAISNSFIVWGLASVVFFIIGLFIAKPLAIYYFKLESAKLLFILLMAGFVLNIIDHLIMYVFQGFQRIGLFASMDFMRTFLLFVTAAGLYWVYPASVFVPALAYILTPILLTLLFYPILKRKVFPKLKLVWFDRSLFGKMVNFGFPVTITALSYTLFQQTTILILTYFGTLEEVGLLNVALPTSALLINLSTAISFVLFPMASELSARGLKGHLQEGVKILYKYSFICIVPLCLMLVAYPDLIISLLFGKKFSLASNALVILALGSIFWTIANINFTTLAAIGKSKEPLKTMSVVIVISVILGLILIPMMGLRGAALSVSLSYVVAMIISTIMIHKHVEVKLGLGFWLKNLVAGLLFISVIHLTKNILNINQYFEAVMTLTISGFVYLSVLLILKMISIKEIVNNLKHLTKRNS